MTITSDLTKIREARAAYKALIQDIGTNGVKELCEEAMNIMGATKVRWAQYTPYFADGDPCVFSVNTPSFYVGNPDVADEYGNEGWVDNYSEGYGYESVDYDRSKKWDDPTRVTYTYKDDIQKLRHETFNNFERDLGELEELLLEVFDDHKEITYENGGFTVEDYDHD